MELIDIMPEPFVRLDKDLENAAATLSAAEAYDLLNTLRQRSTIQDNGCWEWVGARTKAGYGQLCRHRIVKGKPIYTHRLAYLLLRGEILEGLHVLHSCDNPSCWRPDHLFLGTNQDNTDDKIRKGRMRHGHLYGDENQWSRAKSYHGGEKHPRAIFSWEQVRAIRALYAAGGTSQYELARIYGVSRSAISQITTNRHWKEDTNA